MAHDPAAYKRLRSQLVEAAAKYEPAGFRLFVERSSPSEDASVRSGRNEIVGWIHWPYKPWRKCEIFAPSSGSNKKPFSVMKRLFTKAWLWLPDGVKQGTVDAAEKHLTPRPEFGLSWARFDYQWWAWLLWFDWIWRYGDEEDERRQEKCPAAGMDMPPFSRSANLIARWGLDGTDLKLPAWLTEVVPPRKVATGESDKSEKDGGGVLTPLGNTTQDNVEAPPDKTVAQAKPKAKRSTRKGEARDKMIAALTEHHKYACGGCLNLEPIGNNELADKVKVGHATANRFFNEWFGSAKDAKDGYENYKIACNAKDKLIAILKAMNGELPRPGEVLFGRKVPDEAENPDHQGGTHRKPRGSNLRRHDDR